MFDGTYGTSNVPSSSGSSGGGGGSSSGGSGGAGGSGGGTTVKPDDNKDDETTKPDDNKDNEVVIPPVDVVTPSFTDVNEGDWFFEYVEALLKKGIVSGDGSGKFSPTDNVTREQFLKMLVEAADIDAEEAENIFADVADDAWYTPYVLKAKNFGIVNGVSDTEFGIGSNITRQDMAVMITRTFENLDIEISGNDTEDFADADKVSSYAKESVAFMKSIGLIEGYNNEYRPLDNLTRAEASKVICGVLNLIEIANDNVE